MGKLEARAFDLQQDIKMLNMEPNPNPNPNLNPTTGYQDAEHGICTLQGREGRGTTGGNLYHLEILKS